MPTARPGETRMLRRATWEVQGGKLQHSILVGGRRSGGGVVGDGDGDGGGAGEGEGWWSWDVPLCPSVPVTFDCELEMRWTAGREQKKSSSKPTSKGAFDLHQH